MPKRSKSGSNRTIRLCIVCTCRTRRSSRCPCKRLKLPLILQGYPLRKRAKGKSHKPHHRNISIIVKHLSPGRSTLKIRPVVKRYFYQVPDDIRLEGEGLVLYPHQFADDTGEPAAKFMDFGHEGYFNLYVNGVMQEGKLYQAHADKLTIAATGQSIIKGTPIILESIGFYLVRRKKNELSSP